MVGSLPLVFGAGAALLLVGVIVGMVVRAPKHLGELIVVWVRNSTRHLLSFILLLGTTAGTLWTFSNGAITLSDVWGECIKAIIAEDRPTLRAINPRTWIKRTNYRDLEFQSSLRAFATQRAELMAVLDPLPPEGWARAATVTGAGKVLERTVQFYAQWLARHERPHIKQIAGIVNEMSARITP